MGMPNAIALKARYIFPVAAEPLPDGIVTIESGRIVAVGQSAAQGAPVIELEEELGIANGVAILPGLVNAHTHLEFSDLEKPLGQPGMPFVDWIRTVIAHRAANADPQQLLEKKQAAIADGLSEALQSGTTLLGEIATTPFPLEPFQSSPLQGVAFLECLGLDPIRIQSSLQQVDSLLNSSWSSLDGWKPGLSPHAPYSTHWDLFARLCLRSNETGVPVATHLAESREEVEFLKTGRGPFRDLLHDLGIWRPELNQATRPFSDYLRRLAVAETSLLVHGNYLGRGEIQLLARTRLRSRVSVVYCPRTHAYFGHDPYPLAEMLHANVNVALGTDSRASNPDLNLLEEMREVARRHANLPGEFILRMGTSGGARALACGDRVGTIEAGKEAHFAVVTLPGGSSNDPYELLFDSTSPVAATYLHGRRVA